MRTVRVRITKELLRDALGFPEDVNIIGVHDCEQPTVDAFELRLHGERFKQLQSGDIIPLVDPQVSAKYDCDPEDGATGEKLTGFVWDFPDWCLKPKDPIDGQPGPPIWGGL